MQTISDVLCGSTYVIFCSPSPFLSDFNPTVDRSGKLLLVLASIVNLGFGRRRHLWPPFTVSDSRLSEPGGPGPRIYIPQEQGGPVVPPGTGLPFRRLLRPPGLRWRYSRLTRETLQLFKCLRPGYVEGR
jgi:hypothetical protein